MPILVKKQNTALPKALHTRMLVMFCSDLIRKTGGILDSTWELHFQNGYKQMESNTDGEKTRRMHDI